MHVNFKAKSSGAAPYNVIFTIEDKVLKAFCDCKAGQFGKLCKHKTELIAGDESRLYDSSQAPELSDLQSLITESEGLREIAKEISKSEEIIRREQSKLRSVKGEFAKRLSNGINL